MNCVMTAEDIVELFEQEFPQIGPEFSIETVAPMQARVRWSASEAHLRPGGTVSGPTMFTLADLGVYVAVLAMIGPKASGRFPAIKFARTQLSINAILASKMERSGSNWDCSARGMPRANRTRRKTPRNTRPLVAR